MGAEYRGEGELPELLVSTPYLAIVVGVHNSQSSGERVFYCKGNLAVLRKSLKLARDDPKRIYKNNIYKQGLDTTDLARDDPKRIL